MVNYFRCIDFHGTIILEFSYLFVAVTNVGADVQDLYIIDDAGDGVHYWANGNLLPYTVRQDTIYIKDEAAVRLFHEFPNHRR